MMPRGAMGQILRSQSNLEQWVEKHEYKGYEPFDGLSSFLRPFTFGRLFLDRILMQAVRQTPINLRPFIGIKPLDSTIGRGYMASGYLHMLGATGNGTYADRAVDCLEWLMGNGSPGYEELCWGKHFDFASRGGRYPKLEPITVWTSLIGMSFLDAYERLHEQRYLDTAESVCRWILSLSRNETNKGICFSYTGDGDDTCTIHNHSMLAAAMLARTAMHSGKEEYVDVARRAMRYSCESQLPSGAWYYGEERMYHWIDNFHTGYNLDSIRSFIDSTGDTECEHSLLRGLEFYKNHFFEDTGRPRYYHDRTYPVDSQCISQSIDTLAGCANIDPSCLPLSINVARWAIKNMQDEDGHFYYRYYPVVRAKAPMLHWAQATMYCAMGKLLAAS